MRRAGSPGPRPVCLAAVLASTAWAGATAAVGQTVVPIGEDDACSECSVDLERVATLRPPSERVGFLVIPSPDIAQDRAGRYVAGPMVGEAALAVFDGSGALSHVFGRFGQGPGEFSDSRMFIRIGAGDTVHVFQDVRHTVLAPGAREFVRTRQMQVRPLGVALVGSTAVLRVPVQAPRGRVTALQVLARDGSVALGIDTLSDGGPGSTNPLWGARRLARSRGDDGVWSAHWTRYEIGSFDLKGRPEVRVVRDAPWFPPRDDYVSGEGYSTRARPKTEGLVEPNDGTLWVAISEGDPAYEPPDLPPGAEGDPIDAYEDDNGRLDTVLEVLDIRQGRLLARAEVDPYLRFVSTPDDEPLLYSMRTLDTGDVVVDVWRALKDG